MPDNCLAAQSSIPRKTKKTPKLVNNFSRVEHHFINSFTTIQNIYIYCIQKKMSMNPILPLHTWWRHHLLNSFILNIDHKRTLEVVKRYVCVQFIYMRDTKQNRMKNVLFWVNKKLNCRLLSPQKLHIFHYFNCTFFISPSFLHQQWKVKININEMGWDKTKITKRKHAKEHSQDCCLLLCVYMCEFVRTCML